MPKKGKDPAPFSHLYGKKVRNPHTFQRCPMRGCDNCQCLLCGKALAKGEQDTCGTCARENDFGSYSKEEVTAWMKGLASMHKMQLKNEH